MIYRVSIMVSLLFLFSCGSKPDLKGFEKMEGSWKADSDQGMFIETWVVNGDHLTGQGFLINGKDTAFGEKLAVKIINDTLVYIADVPKQEPVNFSLLTSKNNTWIFRNKHHDFPRTITYTLNSDDNLHVELFGFRNVIYDGFPVNEPMTEEFNFERVKND